MKIPSSLWRFLSSVILAGAPLWALAQSAPAPVGYVKNVTGDAFVVTGGQSVKAQPGTAVLLGSLLKTAPLSSMGVTFKDNTLMSFGPDTEMTVEEYLYAPAEGELKLSTRLTRGTLNYVSGVIAKLKPTAVTIQTPTGIIGVRGTQFVAKVEEPR